MSNSKFALFKPYQVDGPPYYDKDLNSHVCLIETIKPGERGNKIATWALNKYKEQKMNAADSAGIERSDEQRLAKGVMGILVEGWVRGQIRDFLSKQKEAFFKISSTGPTINKDGDFEQVDILIEKESEKNGVKNEVSLKIEIRSSFNFHSIGNAIFGGFSILGPYGNEVKPGETIKDIYLFVAVDLHQKTADKKYIIYTDDKQSYIDYAKTTTNILLNHTLSLTEGAIAVRNDFDIVLVGGATVDMFDDGFLVETIKNNNGYQNDDFKSIPIHKALDAAVILKKILSM